MRVLLDTHILQWLMTSPQKLRPIERDLLGRDGVTALISAVTIWELRIKWNLFHASGDRKGEIDPREAIEFARDHELDLMALAPEDCAAILDKPAPNRDPFDEMLLLHAQQLGAKLLTYDRRLIEHPLALKLG